MLRRTLLPCDQAMEVSMMLLDSVAKVVPKEEWFETPANLRDSQVVRGEIHHE